MGTRSLIHFKDGEDTICTVYRQFDGYPEGRGKELAEFLAGVTMRNGFGMGDTARTHANGMGCLAAQWIVFEKDDQLGNVYIYKPDSSDCWEEYTYTVSYDDEKDQFTISMRGYDNFDGSPQDFLAFLEKLAA